LKSALGGIKVLDVTGGGPARLAATMLGDMGADVIKIDLPPGAGSRGVGDGIDYLPTDPQELQRLAANDSSARNKEYVAINLRTEGGQRVFHRLVETSDVILESFRPGVMDRMNVGYKAVSKTNPMIIYCAVSGYGQTGPYSNLPGHDANYVSMAGVQGLIGNSREEAPVFALNIVADMAVAFQHSVIGILLALCARERTGRGQMVDISMTDGIIPFLAGIPQVMDYFYSGFAPQRGEAVLSGNRPYYAAYRTRDNKWLTLCPLEPKFWGNMCHALGRQDLIPQQYDPAMNGTLLAELREIFLTKTRDEWFDLLAKADVPVGKVLDLEEISSDPQLLHRQMIMEMDHPTFGKVRQLGFGIKFSDTPGTIRRLGGLLGQDTDKVLTAAGYSPAEIDELRRQGAVY
jgi:crotonobetainyl-CoA:carnitine CoA-transferase CaiB-like acyl-CoA transferase